MDKQTFIDSMTGRGYELRLIRNGNITATKGDDMVRFVPSPTTSTRRPRPR